QGRLDEAEPLMRESLRIARASGSGPRIAETARYLGLLLARVGRFDEARRLLDEAHVEYELAGEPSEVLWTEARLAEFLVVEGSAEDALQSAERTLERAPDSDGIFPLRPTLHRMRGIALLQLGRLDEARAALDESIESARKAGAEYEVALALDALAALGRLEGRDTETVERERNAILTRLGVVATPEVPLPPDRRES